ncbi:hypothetical protein J4052_09035 [Bacillus toyonensis]|nr:hypothetical protein [Bacillus toyonensis]
MSINIGDNNKIKNSSIGHQHNSSGGGSQKREEKKTFYEKHPILVSALVSLVIGFVLLFSFWKDIADWIEKLF